MYAFLRDQRFWLGTGPKVLAALLALNVAVALDERRIQEARARNLLVVPPAAGEAAGVPRWDQSVGERTGAYLQYIPDARRQPLVIVTGMSQMYAINDAKPGDRTIAEWLDDLLAPSGVRAFGLAAPNITNEEVLLLLATVLRAPPTRPSVFLWGVCFDKLRNVGVRPGLQALLRDDPEVRAAWSELIARYGPRFPSATAAMRASLAAATAVPDEDDSVEAKVRTQVARFVPLVRVRQDLSVALQLRAFFLRNAVFGITPSSKRPVIRERYRLNQELTELILEVARAADVTPALFINPLNPQADNPYIPEEYQAFKAWLKDLAAARSVALTNLEDEVPAPDWGELLGGPDFKHFRGAGHEKTARALVRELGPVLTAAAGH